MSKILVITIGRSGSTNLCKGIADNLNLQFIDEPFSPLKSENFHSLHQSKIKLSKDIIVKHIWYHTIGDIHFMDFINSLIDWFDYIIILTRKNTKEHFESLVNLKYKTKINQDVFEKYYFEEIPNTFIEEYKKTLTIEKLKNQNNHLLNISEKNNIRIIYYEDLYSNNIDSNFNLLKSVIPNINENIKDYLDNKKRQRVFKEIKTII